MTDLDVLENFSQISHWWKNPSTSARMVFHQQCTLKNFEFILDVHVRHLIGGDGSDNKSGGRGDEGERCVFRKEYAEYFCNRHK